MSLDLDGSSAPSFNDGFPRQALAADRPVDLRHPDDLVLSTSRGDIVLCCPVNGVGLTRPMA